MTLKEKLFTELDLYVNKEEFISPHVILNVTNLETWKSASDEEKAFIKETLLNHRISKGIFCKGFKMFLDSKSMDIKTEDIHIVNVEVISKNNRPKAIATFTDDIESIILGGKGFRREVYLNADKTIEKIQPIQVIMSANDMEIAFDNAKYKRANDSTIYKMSYSMIRFSENSITEYYSFGKTSCVKLTPAMVNKYWNGNDFTLTKHTVNLDSHANGWGLIFPTWSDQLIYVDWGSVYIEEELTEEEINIISKGHEDSWIIKDVRQKYRAMHNNDEEDKSNKKEKMNNIIKSFETVINNHDEEIINGVISKLGFNSSDFDSITDRVNRINAKRNFLAKREANFGFDCGFLYFRFKDEELNDLAKEVATYGLDKFCSDGTFILDIPYENQSTTIKRFEAQIIRDLLKENALPEISYKTVLD